jgi:hypothetical protein
MGDSKERLLRRLDRAAILPDPRASATRAVWTGFLGLCSIARTPAILDAESIAAFRTAARAWVAALARPSTGSAHQPGFQRGMYANARVTPYMHALAEHLPDRLEHAAKLGYKATTRAGPPDGTRRWQGQPPRQHDQGRPW